MKREKCQFMARSIEYLGHRIDAEGLHPTAEKVEAMKRAPCPRNVTELKSFLCIINYYGKFVPGLATTLAPLYELLRKRATWIWADSQRRAFRKAKQALSSSSVLVHYDSQRPILLHCDASPYGIGAVLTQVLEDGQERPVAFASRSLSTAEQNYAHIDREALSIVFAIKKFCNYVYGRESKSLPTTSRYWDCSASFIRYRRRHPAESSAGVCFCRDTGTPSCTGQGRNIPTQTP